MARKQTTPKYEKAEKKITASGKAFLYDQKAVERVDNWMAANTDHFSMTLPVGVKQALKAGGEQALGRYMYALLEQDMIQRIRNGSFSQDQLKAMILEYDKTVQERRKKYPNATFREESPMMDEIRKRAGL